MIILIHVNLFDPTKKNVPALELESDFIKVKAYQNNPEWHNVLLYDRIVVFCMRNKVFGSALTLLSFITNIEIKMSELFKNFNETYDKYIDNIQISNTIQVCNFSAEKE